MPADEVLSEAARRMDATVEVERVSSNERLVERMLAQPAFDLVFPSDYMVERLRSARGILPLDREAVPLERIADWARTAVHDPGCEWSVPFAYGTTGYLCTARDGGSWAALFEPPPGTRVGMLDEVREVMGAALIATGHDPNDVTDDALGAAASLLVRQRPSVARYDSDDFVTPVVSGEVPVHHAWSGPAAHAVREHPGLRYVVPEEGATLWITTAAIPRDAPDPARSHRLLEELMGPELAARTTLLAGFATPNEAARWLLPRELREDRSLFPDADTLARCHVFRDLGPEEARLTSVWGLVSGPMTG
jgi:spermidine/putrescine transport system substrate-binding protein